MPRSPAHQRATGRVTLADVALAAGVSPITVSRALRGERAVDPLLVERVQAAALKLGYVPDPAARALASKRSTHVAVLIPMLSNELFVGLLEAAQTRLRAAGYQTLIGITHYDPSEEEQLLREQLMHRPAGLLVTGFDRTEATRRLMAQSGVPCVHMMENSADPAVYSVGFSQTDAAVTMTRHLLAQGYRRIAFAAAQLDPRTLQRQQGWRQALQAEGLYDPALEWMNPAPSSMALGGRLFQQIMGQSPSVDAVFFCNDDLAQGALLAANRLQIAVPQRVAIAGFNDLTGSDLMLPALSTVHTPLARIGDEAAGLLLKLMRGEPVTQGCIALDYQLVVRKST
ncbi:LacI family DNA-binding transcriptional regulator [Curvibacter sp. HBC28]|uniref:LacI family DNA-binding transcriptional regulator n=1 Tax=Curvibacter microcysteis TaxID=3026419 RepID=A0ABT5MGS4_9BURK|nr:LacI family DNA-binding transcriptional regulator [Curvibacter sp. HBC28]MDD0815758.1 LacI family DNA-binding transcriptional regulator [Curvibacter sp. HBC28]